MRFAALPALFALAIAAGCTTTSQNKAEWVRDRDDAISLKSALYWCTKVKVEKFHKQSEATLERKRERVLDEKCMNSRGWKRSA